MKSDILEITRTTASREIPQVRMWSDGQRTSRADVAMVPKLDVATVDAVFEEPTVSFINETEVEPSRTMESLSSQLKALEAQCAKMREQLELAIENRFT